MLLCIYLLLENCVSDLYHIFYGRIEYNDNFDHTILGIEFTVERIVDNLCKYSHSCWQRLQKTVPLNVCATVQENNNQTNIKQVELSKSKHT